MFDGLPEKCESPPYNAVTVVVPMGSAEVVKLAEPLVNDPVPSTIVPSINETASPFGGAGVTIAVKVTACP